MSRINVKFVRKMAIFIDFKVWNGHFAHPLLVNSKKQERIFSANSQLFGDHHYLIAGCFIEQLAKKPEEKDSNAIYHLQERAFKR